MAAGATARPPKGPKVYHSGPLARVPTSFCLFNPARCQLSPTLKTIVQQPGRIRSLKDNLAQPGRWGQLNTVPSQDHQH